MKKIINSIRRNVIVMSHKSQTAETGSALSCCDILAILYFKILDINPKRPNFEKRDRFIMSKGHGAAALYATLAERGYFSKKILEKYRVDGGILHGHPCKYAVPGIEFSTGALGHGLSIAAGISLALTSKKSNNKVYVLMGDGECNEGSVWEAAMFIGTRSLWNIVVIIDLNLYQGFGESKDMNNRNIESQWKSFGWETYRCKGHDIKSLESNLKLAKFNKKPTVIVAETVIGKGIPHIENKLLAHYYISNEDDINNFDLNNKI